MDYLRQRLAVVLEPELLPYQLVLIGDHEIELLYHAAATRLAEVLLLVVDIQITIYSILIIIIWRLLLEIDGSASVGFACQLLLRLADASGSCTIAGILDRTFIYIYEFGEVVHDVVFIQVIF